MTTSMTRTDVGVAGRPGPDAGQTAVRTIRPRRGAPNHRAIVGGILVAVSAVALLALGQMSTGPTPRPWLVITNPVAQGERITANDLGRVDMDLHPATAARAFGDADIGAVIGKVALVPLQPGDLVQRATVADERVERAGNTGRRVGLELDVADALNGELSTGMRVDVVTTNSDDQPLTIARDALVTGIADDTEAGVGRRDAVRITIEIADLETAELVVGASNRDDITLIAGSARGE